MGWDVPEGDCESACEGLPRARTVTAESGVSQLGEGKGEGEGEGMSATVRAAPLAVDELDTLIVIPSL